MQKHFETSRRKGSPQARGLTPPLGFEKAMETPSKKGAQKRRGLAGTEQVDDGRQGTKEVIRFSLCALLENVRPIGEKASTRTSTKGSEGSLDEIFLKEQRSHRRGGRGAGGGGTGVKVKKGL